MEPIFHLNDQVNANFRISLPVPDQYVEFLKLWYKNGTKPVSQISGGRNICRSQSSIMNCLHNMNAECWKNQDLTKHDTEMLLNKIDLVVLC